MISGKDVRIENGYIIINGEKYPIVQDVDALDERITALEEVSGVITLNTEAGWTFDSGVVNTVKKQGDIAWISSYIFNTNTLTQDTLYEIGTLPDGFIPEKISVFPIYGSDSATLNGVVTIGTDGKIKYKAVNTGRYAIYSAIMYPLD